MKKLVSILLTAALLLSLTACGNTPKKAGTTTIVDSGDAKIETNVTTNDDGSISLEFLANSFNTMEGSIVGFQFTVAFENATYDSYTTPEFPEGWVSTFSDAQTANKNNELTCAFYDDNLSKCFPNQSICTLTFKDISDKSDINVKDIKMTFFVNDDFSKRENNRVFYQDDFTAYK